MNEFEKLIYETEVYSDTRRKEADTKGKTDDTTQCPVLKYPDYLLRRKIWLDIANCGKDDKKPLSEFMALVKKGAEVQVYPEQEAQESVLKYAYNWTVGKGEFGKKMELLKKTLDESKESDAEKKKIIKRAFTNIAKIDVYLFIDSKESLDNNPYYKEYMREALDAKHIFDTKVFRASQMIIDSQNNGFKGNVFNRVFKHDKKDMLAFLGIIFSIIRDLYAKIPTTKRDEVKLNTKDMNSIMETILRYDWNNFDDVGNLKTDFSTNFIPTCQNQIALFQKVCANNKLAVDINFEDLQKLLVEASEYCKHVADMRDAHLKQPKTQQSESLEAASSQPPASSLEASLSPFGALENINKIFADEPNSGLAEDNAESPEDTNSHKKKKKHSAVA